MFILIVALVLLAVVGAFLYVRYQTDRRLNGGEVLSMDTGKVSDHGAAPVLAPTRSETLKSASNNAEPRKPAVAMSTAPMPSSTYPPTEPTMQTTDPQTDTIAHDPPNHAAFAGTGRYQVYRQGDLTWRLNTDTGSTCVLFATLEQWRKPVVYRNACTTP